MMTMATKHTIIEEKLAKYLKASKEGKSKLLDYIYEITGLHRKSVTRRFNLLQNRDDQIPSRRGREMIYGPRVDCALKEIWDCSARSAPSGCVPVWLNTCGFWPLKEIGTTAKKPPDCF